MRITVDQLPEVKNENLVHLQRYVKFINSRPERDLHQSGLHTHHIYPRSLAKKNEVEDFDGDWNLIELTPREHFIAHMILFYCKYNEMIHAFFYIVKTYGLKESCLTSRQYQRLNEENTRILKNKIWLFNEDGDEIAVQSEDVDRYIKDGFYYGRSCTLTKNKISVTNGLENFFIEKEKLDSYLKMGYRLGQTGKTTKNRTRITKNAVNKSVDKDQLQDHLDDGWIRGIENHNKFKRTKITNGTTNHNVTDIVLDIYLANGWVLGTTKKPTLDRKRMTNGVENKFVKENDQKDYTLKGWVFGFTAETTKNRLRINKDGLSKLIKREQLDDFILNGWILGLPKNTGDVNG